LLVENYVKVQSSTGVGEVKLIHPVLLYGNGHLLLNTAILNPTKMNSNNLLILFLVSSFRAVVIIIK